jgi:hypothetical protein
MESVNQLCFEKDWSIKCASLLENLYGLCYNVNLDYFLDCNAV